MSKVGIAQMTKDDIIDFKKKEITFPFIRYCKSKYGVTDDEMENVWAKYKHRMWERMIEPR
jgi:hypothetical protein